VNLLPPALPQGRKLVLGLLWLTFACPLLLGCGSKPSGPITREEVEDGLSRLGEHDPETTSPQISGQSRAVRLTYEVEIEAIPAGQTAKIWIPQIHDDPYQSVEIVSVQIPGDLRSEQEAKYGNEYWYTEAQPNTEGKVLLKVVYDVRRQEVTPRNYVAVKPGEVETFLQENKLVPIGGEPLEALLQGKTWPTDAGQKARGYYDLVLKHVDYKKPEGEPWGRGDTNWVCESQFGNCTDFHSLFISLCRSTQVPARFEIGFPLGSDSESKIGGYHCWAYFDAEDLWHPVDISEADKNEALREYYFGRLTADRIAVTQGRDIELTPLPAAGSLNYFINPWVEVGDQPHTQMVKRYRYEPLPQEAADAPSN
jgi:transglutaminase-like putative cysteine protease